MFAKIRIIFYTTKDCVKKNKENIISITTTKTTKDILLLRGTASRHIL